jgi:MFS family permease
MQSPFKDLPREISILVAASFFVAVGFGIVLPAIPVFAQTFGVNNAAIGLVISMFAITRFASGLISGKLVDLFGERVVFSTGVFMVALFVLLAGLSTTYTQLLIFRAAGGLGSSMFSVAAGSVIMRAVDDEHRGRHFHGVPITGFWLCPPLDYQLLPFIQSAIVCAQNRKFPNLKLMSF